MLEKERVDNLIKTANGFMSMERFDGHAKAYTVGRPDYAEELIECLYSDYGVSASAVIADIGSGTGKFSRHLLERGSEVYSVEPSDDMRSIAETELGRYPNFHSVKGSAENTTLKADLADYITTAQAFHWFDVSRFRQECMRIIKDNGKVILVWNIRDDLDPLNQELYKVYSDDCPEFKGFGGGILKDDQRIKDFFGSGYDYRSFDHLLCLDKEMFVARSLSASYSLKEGDAGYEAYMEALLDVFNRYEDNGSVTIANKSVAYIGSIK